MKPGDKVIPCYTPECGEPDCIFCNPPRGKRTNLCPKIRATQGSGVMPDGTTRFKDADGNSIQRMEYNMQGFCEKNLDRGFGSSASAAVPPCRTLSYASNPGDGIELLAPKPQGSLAPKS